MLTFPGRLMTIRRMTAAILLAVMALAYANGANDNFKGVATLFGSRTTDYRRALGWATAATLLGSLLAVWLATQLLARFSGKGLVPDALTTRPYCWPGRCSGPQPRWCWSGW